MKDLDLNSAEDASFADPESREAWVNPEVLKLRVAKKGIIDQDFDSFYYKNFSK